MELEEMTHDTFVAFQTYIDACARAVGMNKPGTPTVDASPFCEPADYNVAGSVTACTMAEPGTSHRVIAGSDLLFELDPYEFRRVIAHELAHCMIVAVNDVELQLPIDREALEAAIELDADNVAECLQHVIPLPPTSLCGDLSRGGALHRLAKMPDPDADEKGDPEQ